MHRLSWVIAGGTAPQQCTNLGAGTGLHPCPCPGLHPEAWWLQRLWEVCPRLLLHRTSLKGRWSGRLLTQQKVQSRVCVCAGGNQLMVRILQSMSV